MKAEIVDILDAPSGWTVVVKITDDDGAVVDPEHSISVGAGELRRAGDEEAVQRHIDSRVAEVVRRYEQAAEAASVERGGKALDEIVHGAKGREVSGR